MYFPTTIKILSVRLPFWINTRQLLLQLASNIKYDQTRNENVLDTVLKLLYIFLGDLLAPFTSKWGPGRKQARGY